MLYLIYMLINFLKPIVIIGIMGSGKTNFAKKLSQKLKLNAIDLDFEITQKNDNVKSLIAEIGIEEYQAIELSTLKQSMQKNSNNTYNIVSTGDIIVDNRAAMEYVFKNSTTIWLNPNLKIIYNRLKINNNRPLLNENLTFEEFKDLFLKRKKIYQKANFEIKNTSNKK